MVMCCNFGHARGSMREDAHVAELLAHAKDDVLKIWAARAQCHEGSLVAIRNQSQG